MGEVYALHNTVHIGLERLVDKPKRHDLIHRILEVASGGGVGVSAADDDIVIGVKVSVGLRECLDHLGGRWYFG